MSDPTATNQAAPPIDPELGLVFTVAEHLIPLFKTGAVDTHLARRMAISAIGAYRPETQADHVNVARTIAFSMAALALLGQAAAQDVSMAEKMRALARANALNRSADQSERTMMQRRRHQQANPPAETQAETLVPPIDDAVIEAAIAGAMAEYMATRAPAKAEAPPPDAQHPEAQPPAAQPPAAQPRPAPIAAKPQPDDRLGQPPTANTAPAIRYTVPRPNDGKTGSVPYRQELLSQTAMPQVTGQARTQGPR